MSWLWYWIKTLFQTLFYTAWWKAYGVLAKTIDYRSWRWRASFRMARVGIPAAFALGTFLLLTVVVVAVFLWLLWQPNAGPWEWLRSWWVFTVLAVGISIVAFVLVRLFLQDDEESFEDIDFAWKAGLAALASHGIYLKNAPLFLVLGLDSNDRAKRLFKASGLELAVENVPAGANALHWYASSEAIFLVCSSVGCLTRMSRDSVQKLLQLRSQVSAQGPAPQQELWSTAWPSEDPLEAAEADSPPPAAAPRSVPKSIGETAVPDRDEGDALPETEGQAAGRLDLTLRREEVDRETARVEYLCRLIAQTRRPFAPLNGLVTLLPHNLILCDRSEGAGLREAVRRDVSTAVRCLRLRFPAYVVISGWEGDEGFHELVRRLGPDIPAAKRFGKGAELWAAPLPSRLEAVCMHACGAFEDWIYHLFRQSDSTKRTTNRALFGLLCKIRRYLRPRLLNLIPDGCGCDEEGKHVQEASLFGGCYFVAAGREPGSQAFAAGIFQRMLGEQQELEWTPPALRADELHWRVAWVGFAASLGFIILTIVAAYLQFRGGAP